MFEEQFIRENLAGSIYFKSVSDAYRDYREYCLEAGSKPLGRNNFSKRMEAIGFEKSHKEKGWVLEKRYFEKKV